MSIEMLKLELKNLEVSAHSSGGWLRDILIQVSDRFVLQLGVAVVGELDW